MRSKCRKKRKVIKNGEKNIDGLKSGMVFKGTTRAYKRICIFKS